MFYSTRLARSGRCNVGEGVECVVLQGTCCTGPIVRDQLYGTNCTGPTVRGQLTNCTGPTVRDQLYGANCTGPTVRDQLYGTNCGLVYKLDYLRPDKPMIINILVTTTYTVLDILTMTRMFIRIVYVQFL